MTEEIKKYVRLENKASGIMSTEDTRIISKVSDEILKILNDNDLSIWYIEKILKRTLEFTKVQSNFKKVL